MEKLILNNVFLLYTVNFIRYEEHAPHQRNEGKKEEDVIFINHTCNHAKTLTYILS
jgi:hypothetical protein